MSLPLPWVDRIFDKLTLTYGQAFLARWRDIDINAVKSDWTHELSGFEHAPHAIAFALSHLPDKPPSIVDFKALCRQAPSAETKQLEAPKADPERVKAELAKLGQIREKAPGVPLHNDPKAWAHRILTRHAAGEKISPTVVQMARQGAGQTEAA